jgi:hypothetical protein
MRSFARPRIVNRSLEVFEARFEVAALERDSRES